MDATFRKVALAAATLGLVLSLFIALRPDDDDDESRIAPPATTEVAPPTLEALPATTEAAPATTSAKVGREIRIDVVAGIPQGGIQRIEIDVGDDVVIVVRSDVADHIHLHGYDLMADVAPGSPGRLRFTADVPGRFEVELEERRILIADLQVRP